MRDPRLGARVFALALALSAGALACATLAGLEDKQAYDDAGHAPGDEAGSTDDAGAADAAQLDGATAFVIGPAEVFAAAQSKPWGVAVDDGFVYWTNEGDGTVRRAPKAGGAARIIAGDQREPHRLLVDATSIVWHNENFTNATTGTAGSPIYEIAHLAKSGIDQDAAPAKIEDLRSNQKVRSLAISKIADNELWTLWSDKLRRNRRDDTNGGKDLVKGLDPAQPTAVAVDDVNAYWFLQESLQIWRIPKVADGTTDAGVTLATLTGTPEIADMVADGTALYMVTTGGTVLKLPTPAGGTPTQLAMGHPFPRGITEADKYVYFTTTSGNDAVGEGAVVMVAKSGGETISVAKGQNRPRGLAVDVAADGSTTLYWATYGDGKIWRVRVR